MASISDSAFYEEPTETQVMDWEREQYLIEDGMASARMLGIVELCAASLLIGLAIVGALYWAMVI